MLSFDDPKAGRPDEHQPNLRSRINQRCGTRGPAGDAVGQIRAGHNLSGAKALGFIVAAVLLARADEVIE
jgi:hypothetical protein